MVINLIWTSLNGTRKNRRRHNDTISIKRFVKIDFFCLLTRVLNYSSPHSFTLSHPTSSAASFISTQCVPSDTLLYFYQVHFTFVRGDSGCLFSINRFVPQRPLTEWKNRFRKGEGIKRREKGEGIFYWYRDEHVSGNEQFCRWNGFNIQINPNYNFYLYLDLDLCGVFGLFVWVKKHDHSKSRF